VCLPIVPTGSASKDHVAPSRGLSFILCTETYSKDASDASALAAGNFLGLFLETLLASNPQFPHAPWKDLLVQVPRNIGSKNMRLESLLYIASMS
jgi:hypothetical protein